MEGPYNTEVSLIREHGSNSTEHQTAVETVHKGVLVNIVLLM